MIWKNNDSPRGRGAHCSSHWVRKICGIFCCAASDFSGFFFWFFLVNTCHRECDGDLGQLLKQNPPLCARGCEVQTYWVTYFNWPVVLFWSETAAGCLESKMKLQIFYAVFWLFSLFFFFFFVIVNGEIDVGGYVCQNVMTVTVINFCALFIVFIAVSHYSCYDLTSLCQ